jgi:subfamily B ATP-binding cassette protein MsbA
MKSNFEIIKRLYQDYTKNYMGKIILSALLSLIVAGSTSAIAYLLDPAIKKIFVEKDQSLILIIPAFIILAFFAKGISLYAARVLMISVGNDIKKNMQDDMLKSLINADTSLIHNKHSGKYLNHVLGDTSYIVNLVSTTILNAFKDSLTLIGLLSVMFYQNWKLSLIAILMIPIATLAAKSLGKRIGKVTTEAQEKAGETSQYLMELFKNHKLIKIFQKENYEAIRSSNFLHDVKEKSKKIAIVFTRATVVMEPLTGIMIALLIFVTGKLIISGEISINNFFSFLAAMMLAYQPVRSLATLNVGISQGLSAAKRILPIIDIDNKIKDSKESKNLILKNYDIEFKGCNFKYNDEQELILKNVNLKFLGGKMTALVGHSGAGKSSILNLIPRFYDCISGDINIDGQSIYKAKLKDLRKNISIVTQDTTLFDDTIKNNILYAHSSATDDEIQEVAEKSFAYNFIKNLPNKFDTMIGENGVRLSGGEKQRISIARAMLKKAPIILLDEATSSLDAETESKIQEAMSLLTRNKTTIVIAHRLSTILNSNKIFVIDNGNVIAEGTHKELMSNSNTYKNFYEKQIRKD